MPKAEKEEVEAAVEGAESGGGEAPPTTESAPPASTESAPSQLPVAPATVKTKVGYAAVVKTEFVGAEPKEQQIEAQAKLPNEANPAIVYTGISPDETGALFLMTSNVTAFYGHGQCVLGGATCQQLKLRVGKSATFAIGFGETRYKVTLLDFVPIVEEARVDGDG